jgi:hypothetical protein
VEQAVGVARRQVHPLYLAYALIWAYATTEGKFRGQPPREELDQALVLARRWGDLWAIAHSLQGLQEAFTRASAKTAWDRELAEAYSTYGVDQASQWTAGRAMVLDEAIGFALPETAEQGGSG